MTLLITTSTRHAVKPSMFAAILAGLAVFSASADTQLTTPPNCKNGVCAMNVDDALAIAPCEKAPIILAWRQAGGATLVQCETDDADMDKPSFVFDRNAPAGHAFKLVGLKYLDATMLPQFAAGAIPDAFASRTLCSPPKPPRMAEGEILLGDKVSTDDDKNPYCYRVLRVATTPAGVVIHADDNDAPKPIAKHADWDKLAAKMAALIRASSGATPTATAAPADTALSHVVHAKAPLRDSPDAGVAVHGYLVQGDEVSLLDRSKAADGWFKVRYVGKSGNAIERWIRAEDLDIASPAAVTVH